MNICARCLRLRTGIPCQKAPGFLGIDALERGDEMAKKLNYANLRYEKAKKLNIKDEAEFRDNDRAAKWLKKVDQNQDHRKQKVAHRAS